MSSPQFGQHGGDFPTGSPTRPCPTHTPSPTTTQPSPTSTQPTTPSPTSAQPSTTSSASPTSSTHTAVVSPTHHHTPRPSISIGTAIHLARHPHELAYTGANLDTALLGGAVLLAGLWLRLARRFRDGAHR